MSTQHPGREPDHARTVVGIDLGTTNSEIAAFVADPGSDRRAGGVEVLGEGDERILPSYVGLGPDGALLVGEPARNQYLLYPERTIRSIKRKMGQAEPVTLGDRRLTPPEVSSLILRTLREQAERCLGEDVRQAVITVPAYFSDAQRQATRHAGDLAGLDVLRIVNEPTAASLAYGYGEGRAGTVLIYDLGGGTFDVSVVAIEGEVTEVLASHGDNQLGGDDFDALVCELLFERFEEQHGVNLRQGHPAARARLTRAAERAKKALSFAPEATVAEDALVIVEGRPLHLEYTVSRDTYEALVAPLLERTFESVARALEDARVRPDELASVLLVGGSTRTPLCSELFVEHTGIRPRQDVHPDLCVALGAGVLAARLAGHAVERVLVDISPYTFGPAYLGEREGSMYPHCFKPIIARNTALPISRRERFSTASPYQSAVDIDIYQGEDADALNNIHVGNFRLEGLTQSERLLPIDCQMSLDLDGILRVSAIEVETGKQVEIAIDGALSSSGPDATDDAARERLDALFASAVSGASESFAAGEGDMDDRDGGRLEVDVLEPSATPPSSASEPPGSEPPSSEAPDPWAARREAAERLVARSRGLFEAMHVDDRDDAIELHERLDAALDARDVAALEEVSHELSELLFYVEGR